MLLWCRLRSMQRVFHLHGLHQLWRLICQRMDEPLHRIFMLFYITKYFMHM